MNIYTYIHIYTYPQLQLDIYIYAYASPYIPFIHPQIQTHAYVHERTYTYIPFIYPCGVLHGDSSQFSQEEGGLLAAVFFCGPFKHGLWREGGREAERGRGREGGSVCERESARARVERGFHNAPRDFLRGRGGAGGEEVGGG